MGFFINPTNRKDPASAGVNRAASSSAAKERAKRVEDAVEMPLVQKNRDVQILEVAGQLIRKIQKNWDMLSPYELAEEIIDLEGKVALIEGTDPKIEKVKRQAERLHFQFVFPVVLELDSSPKSGMPYTFARAVHTLAKEIFKKQSIGPLKDLNPAQINEVMRFLGKEGG